METLTKITELLKAKGLQQKDLTSFLGVKNSAYTDWKAGKSKSYIKYLYQIARFLDTTPEYLKGESETVHQIDKKEKAPETGKIIVKNAFGTITMAVTKEEAEIIQAYRSYPEVGKKIVRRTLGLEGISPDAATAAYGGKNTQVGKKKNYEE